MIDFLDLIKQYYDEIFYYVYKQLDNIDEAKDITQDIFLKVYQKRNIYNKEKSSIRTWLYRIAHNQCMDYLKSSYYKHKIKNKPLDLNLNNNEDILLNIINKEKAEEVIKIMNLMLNSKHKKILNLYFFSELEVEEISLVLKIPKKTVYNIINESIKKLKRRLEDEYNVTLS